MNFTQLALVFLGGGIGASMRWLLSASAVRFLGTAFPAGTFAVNLIGCFLTTGLLGGFTTFSSFALEAVLLGERGALALSVFYALGSLVLGLGAVVGGIALARAIAG